MTQTIKTGTTCIGLLLKDRVILAADRRTTAGYIASDRSSKVYELSKRIVGTTAGHAAANQKVMRAMKGELKLIELKNERLSRVKEAAMILNSTQYGLIRTEGSIVSIVLGGYDEKDALSLYNLSPDGTILPNEGYVADGSGSLYVKPILDNEYRENLSEREALELLDKCFKTSFRNDNASGGGYIAKVVTKDGVREIARKIIDSKLVEEKEK